MQRHAVSHMHIPDLSSNGHNSRPAVPPAHHRAKLRAYDSRRLGGAAPRPPQPQHEQPDGGTPHRLLDGIAQQHGPPGAVRQPSVVRKPHVASILALVPSSSPRSLVRPRGAHHVAPGVGAGDVTYVSVVALSNALALVDFLLTRACSTTSAAVAGAWRSRFHAPTAASAQRA